MRAFLTILKYVIIFIVFRWLFDRFMPVPLPQAYGIVARGASPYHEYASTRLVLAWASILAYCALPLFMLALCAWDIGTRKARTAR